MLHAAVTHEKQSCIRSSVLYCFTFPCNSSSILGPVLLIQFNVCVCVCLCVGGAFGIQHAEHMHRFILSSVVYLVVLYFSKLPHNWYDFLKQNILANMKCVWIFYTPFV